jgi:predicted membrane-bound dolichyl-phosphate-mannose-protein mannosyltransferase
MSPITPNIVKHALNRSNFRITKRKFVDHASHPTLTPLAVLWKNCYWMKSWLNESGISWYVWQVIMQNHYFFMFYCCQVTMTGLDALGNIWRQMLSNIWENTRR